MKEAGTTFWQSPNTGATDERGSSALPGGYRATNGYFCSLGYFAYFWSSTDLVTLGYSRYLAYNYSGVYNPTDDRRNGFSVRCVKNTPADVNDIDRAKLPGAFCLTQNYPNPFNPTTIIEYSVPTRAHVSVEIFNILGQQVRSLVDEMKSAGRYRTEWNGTDAEGHSVATGVYLYRFKAGGFVETKKMVLLK